MSKPKVGRIIERPRLLLVDDHPLFLRGLRLTLEDAQEFEIVGEATSGKQAIMLSEQLLPEVVLCDINLPDLNGLEVCRMINRRQPQISLIMLSLYEEDEQLFQAIKVGASAFFSKGVKPEQLVEMVRLVAQGQYIINENVLSKPFVARRVLNQFRELAVDDLDPADDQNQGQGHPKQEVIFVSLTNREIGILDEIARGNSNKQIAFNLSISDQTVKNHITSILKKLNANDRTQAVIKALRHGWIKLSPSELK